MSVQFVTLFLQLTVQYTIYKARLRDNQYQLIRLMSIIESLYLLTVITIVSDTLRRLGTREPTNRNFSIFMTFLGYLWITLSMVCSVIISFDRWMAVKYCLRYHAIVTRKKLTATFLSVAFLDAFVLCCMFYLCDVTNTILSNNAMFTSRIIITYTASIRTIACAIMLILGKKTIHYRNGNEQRLRSLNNLHGTQAEELDKLTVLKRGIKDVFTVNFWTCIFLLPIMTISFLIATGIDLPKWIFGINSFLISVCVTSNPVIYLLCYGKIRSFWAPLFRLHRIIPGEEAQENEQ